MSDSSIVVSLRISYYDLIIIHTALSNAGYNPEQKTVAGMVRSFISAQCYGLAASNTTKYPQLNTLKDWQKEFEKVYKGKEGIKEMEVPDVTLQQTMEEEIKELEREQQEDLFPEEKDRLTIEGAIEKVLKQEHIKPQLTIDSDPDDEELIEDSPLANPTVTLSEDTYKQLESIIHKALPLTASLILSNPEGPERRAFSYTIGQIQDPENWDTDQFRSIYEYYFTAILHSLTKGEEERNEGG